MTASARSPLATEMLTRFSKRNVECEIKSSVPGQFEFVFGFSRRADQSHRDALAEITQDVVAALETLGYHCIGRSRTYSNDAPGEGSHLVISVPDAFRDKADELRQSFGKAC